MEYPLKIDVNITQDDYIEVEILEQALDMELWKKSLVKAFAIETAVMALLSVLIVYLSSRGVIMMRTIYFVLFFYMLFAFHFVYTYFWGAKREFNLAVQHLLMNKDTNEFFTPEKGMVYFYEDRCEFLTDEQRRYFDYSLIKHIKVIRHLYIFVMKRSKEKNLKGFAYMVIPKRNLYGDEQQALDSICTDIIERYQLKPWVDSDILG